MRRLGVKLRGFGVANIIPSRTFGKGLAHHVRFQFSGPNVNTQVSASDAPVSSVGAQNGPFIPQPIDEPSTQEIQAPRPPPRRGKWIAYVIGGLVLLAYTQAKEEVKHRFDTARRSLDSLKKPSGPETIHVNHADIRTFSTLCEGRRVNVCVLNDTPAARAKGPAVVINAGTIASARPLALAIAQSVGCVVVTYTHAGLVCDNEEYHALQTLNPYTANDDEELGNVMRKLHDACTGMRPASVPIHLSNSKRFTDLTDRYNEWKNSFRVAASVTMDGIGHYAAMRMLDRNVNALETFWYSTPPQVAAPPTSDYESRELAEVLRSADIPEAVLVSTYYNWLATAKTALRNASVCAGLVLIDPLLPHFEPLRSAVDWLKSGSDGVAGLTPDASSPLPPPLYGTTLGLHPLLPLQEGFAPSQFHKLAQMYAQRAPTQLSDLGDLVQTSGQLMPQGAAFTIGLTNAIPVYGSNILDAVYAQQCLLGSGLDPIGTLPATDLFRTLLPKESSDKVGSNHALPGNFADITLDFANAGRFRTPFASMAHIADGVSKPYNQLYTGVMTPIPSNPATLEAVASLSSSLPQVFAGFQLHHNTAAAQFEMARIYKTARNRANKMSPTSAPSKAANKARAEASSNNSQETTATGSEASDADDNGDGHTLLIPTDYVYAPELIDTMRLQRVMIRKAGISALRKDLDSLIPKTGAINQEAYDSLLASFEIGNEKHAKIYAPLDPEGRLQWVHQQMEALRAENYIDSLVMQFDTVLSNSHFARMISETETALKKGNKKAVETLSAQLGQRVEKIIQAIVKCDIDELLRVSEGLIDASALPAAPISLEKFISAMPPALSLLLAQGSIQRRDFTADANTEAPSGNLAAPGAWMLPILRLALCRAIAARLCSKPPLVYKDTRLDAATALLLLVCHGINEFPVDSPDELSAAQGNVMLTFASRKNAFPDIEGRKVYPVYDLEDAVRAMSLRAQTLEPYRLQLEPHRWSVPAFFAHRFASVVDGRTHESGFKHTVTLQESDPIVRKAAELHGLPATPASVLAGVSAETRVASNMTVLGLVAFMQTNFAAGLKPGGAPTKLPFPVSVYVTTIPDSQVEVQHVWKDPKLHINMDVSVKPFSTTPLTIAMAPSHLTSAVGGTPTPALHVLRAQLQSYQKNLFAWWAGTLPGCVVPVAPETGAEVNATLHQISALLKHAEPIAVVKSLAFHRFPFMRTDLVRNFHMAQGEVHGTPLPALHTPVVSGSLRDSLTLLADAAMYGAPQPYRPPVATLANHIGQIVRARATAHTEPLS